MTVRLLYFAQVREAMGRSEEQIDLPDSIHTVGNLAEWLARRHPIFADRTRLRVAVDQTMADFSTSLDGVTEVAFFPPVTGG